jgi:hypothetical protein
VSTPENGYEMSPGTAFAHGIGPNPNDDSPASSAGGNPSSAHGTDSLKANIHILVTSRVKAKIDTVRGALEREYGRKVSNSEVVGFLADHWENT